MTQSDPQSPPSGTASPERHAPSAAWFWINVATLCALAPWATYWFQQHLQLYFTEIVVIGGVFSIWVFIRAMWGVLEKTAKVDPWEHSRRLLSFPDITALLFVAVIAMIVLWRYTASIYVTYEGAPDEGEYLMEVVRKSDTSPLIPAVSLTVGNAVIGRPFLWQSEASDLECRILRPAKFRVLPCTLQPGHSTRIKVPGSFTSREFHLLRIVPGMALFRQLPSTDGTPVTRYDLELEHDSKKMTLPDLRRETVYAGAAASEMPIVMGLEQPGALERYLSSRLLSKGVDELNAKVTTAVLSLSTRTWPAFYLKQGDHLTFTVRYTQSGEHDTQSGEHASHVLEDVPVVHYTVTAEKVQTVWIPD